MWLQGICNFLFYYYFIILTNGSRVVTTCSIRNNIKSSVFFSHVVFICSIMFSQQTALLFLIDHNSFTFVIRSNFLISNFRLLLNVVCFLLGNSPASEVYMLTFRNTLVHLHRQVGVCINHSTHTYLPVKMEQSVPKRRHINLRRRGNAQKKAYNKKQFVLYVVRLESSSA
jgi:hypothetical protein